MKIVRGHSEWDNKTGPLEMFLRNHGRDVKQD